MTKLEAWTMFAAQCLPPVLASPMPAELLEGVRECRRRKDRDGENAIVGGYQRHMVEGVAQWADAMVAEWAKRQAAQVAALPRPESRP